ncbi:MAG: O-antigen ligase family protein [Gaiellaceae bacterium]
MIRVLDGLLLATMFTVTFTKLRWGVGAADVTLAEIAASAFVLAFVVSRIRTRDWRFPPTAQVLGAFLLIFLLVYLVGYFNLETVASRNLYAKGMIAFAVHFFFLVAAVSHLARRAERFFWLTLVWFMAGLTANAVYGLLGLAYAEATGGELDALALEPLTGEVTGLQLFGVAAGFNIYRTNGLTVDPNHLGIMLLVPLLVLLPVYLRLERGNRLRVPLAALLGFLFLVQLATLSRSALLGLAFGLLVLAIPYGRLFVSPRLLVPLTALAGVVALIVAQRTRFFETILSVRTSVSSSSSRLHIELYDLLGPVLRDDPLFGLGKNTFAAYYEFLTGKSNWGPHSYYLSVLTETGLVGGAVFLAYLVYLFQRLGAGRWIAAALARTGDLGSVRLRALAWGLTAAVVGTMAGNAFYLTMQMYYFFALAVLAFAVPLVFGARARAV